MSARDPQDGAESILRFGTFELDATTCELRRRGILVPLPRQPARTLRLLVLRAGKLVTREDLRRELWGDEVFVDYDSGLAACINQVRVALGDSAASPRFVETLPRQGYRFIAEVRPGTRGEPATDSVATPIPASSPAPPAKRRLSVAAVVAVAVVAAAIGLVALGTLLASRRPAPGATSTRAPSVVVLPIPTPPGDTALAAIAETLTEGVIGELATIAGPRARVASRVQTETLRGRDVDLDAIRALGADYFVAITLRHVGKPVRVHAKLAHGTGWILWSTDYDLEEANLATMQSDVAVALARKAAHEIVPPSDRSAAREPASAAVPDYAQGNSDFDQGRFLSSIEHYEAALRTDPRHLGSYAGLAEAHLHMALTRPERAGGHFAAAQAAVERALAIDANDAGAITAQGALVFARDFAPDRAERLLRHATELEPGLAAGRLWHAEVLAALGDFEAALAEARAGRALAPLSALGNRVLGHVQLIGGDYAALRGQTERILALDPSNAAAHLWRAIASARLGDEADAARSRRAFVAALGLSPRGALLSWEQVYAAMVAAPDGQWLWLRAATAALSGHRADALRSLEACRQLRMVDLQWAAHNPSFEQLHGEPAFVSLIAVPARIAGR